ncbi:beta-lactamase family protein [Candidatus Chloroploca sp. M-50]|uniref:Beta-lactamase family protein n=1 Tax=Candidatus Chloroploca mongolica TaxID=2528176 RepID=A0ABS4D544_9CHLR|nr:beta-lactamase family protein [Candidatus Chloroploca mongolica]
MRQTIVIQQAIAARIFPGAVILATRDGATLLDQAYGTTMYEDEGTRSVVRDDIFDIASLTKVVTATAALRLYDLGELTLDRAITFYLPAARAQYVTVRHLLTHCSGLDLRLSTLRNEAAAGIQAAIYAAEPVKPPGTHLAYTNINSLLLGNIVAVVAGLPLDQAVQKLVLDPLGMHATGYCPSGALRERIVPTEWDDTWRQGLVHGVVHDESAYALGGVAGHAGLFSTARDLERLVRMWLQGGAWADQQVLREATVALALRDATAGLRTDSGQAVQSGLGWMLDRANFMGAAPRGSFGHTGFTGPAIIGVPRSQLALVVLSNRVYPQRTPPPYRHHAVTATILEELLREVLFQ